MGDVIVGVDGSAHANAAADWAAGEARRRHARVRLVHAYTPRVQQYPYNMLDPEALEGMTATERALAEDLVASVADRVRQAHPVEVVTELVASDPSEALIERSGDAELLVLGARGLGGIKGLLLGSVSQRCAQHARCPVVIVPRP